MLHDRSSEGCPRLYKEASNCPELDLGAEHSQKMESYPLLTHTLALASERQEMLSVEPTWNPPWQREQGRRHYLQDEAGVGTREHQDPVALQGSEAQCQPEGIFSAAPGKAVLDVTVASETEGSVSCKGHRGDVPKVSTRKQEGHTCLCLSPTHGLEIMETNEVVRMKSF